MWAVIFEVWPTKEGKEEYLQIAAGLRGFLVDQDGFISIERFQSLTEESKLLSLSFWRDEAAIAAWRTRMEHRQAQQEGRDRVFENYRIRVAEVRRDYGLNERDEVPQDSLSHLK